MKANGVFPDEMTYTALARAAAVSGNPDRAYQLVRAGVAASMPVVPVAAQTRELACAGEGHAPEWSHTETANIHTRTDSLLRQPQPQQRAWKRYPVFHSIQLSLTTLAAARPSRWRPTFGRLASRLQMWSMQPCCNAFRLWGACWRAYRARERRLLTRIALLQ